MLDLFGFREGMFIGGYVVFIVIFLFKRKKLINWSFWFAMLLQLIGLVGVFLNTRITPSIYPLTLAGGWFLILIGKGPEAIQGDSKTSENSTKEVLR